MCKHLRKDDLLPVDRIQNIFSLHLSRCSFHSSDYCHLCSRALQLILPLLPWHLLLDLAVLQEMCVHFYRFRCFSLFTSISVLTFYIYLIFPVLSYFSLSTCLFPGFSQRNHSTLYVSMHSSNTQNK